MDQNLQWFYQKRAEHVLKQIEKNRMAGSWLESKEQVRDHVLGMIPQGSSVALGGSMTLFETGLVDGLRAAPVNLIDRYAPGLDKDGMMACFHAGLTCDVFVSSVNAITEKGELVFIDCNCNRVAPILFGPKQVILVSGANKLVPDQEAAIQRIKYMTAPANAKRLNRKTPCTHTGVCADCDSPDRICMATVIIHKQVVAGRIHVVLVGEDLGY